MSEGPDDRFFRNGAVFREANQHIRDAAVRHEIRDRIPFLCECADGRCTEIIRLSLAEYDSVRSDPRRFINAPDHHLPFATSLKLAERHAGYEVVEADT
jgi:hypothetical protein